MSGPIAPHLLTRGHPPQRKPQGGGRRLMGDLHLAEARVHEFTGPARRTLALALARSSDGPVFWVLPAWMPDRLYTLAVADWIDPGRLVFLEARRADELLWVMEEALRSGAVPLVVADLQEPPGLTPVRRLHLAAEAGATLAPPPIGVLLTPETGGAPGVESRWSFAPDHGTGGRSAWRLDRLRARTLPPAAWEVVPGARGGLVPKAPCPIADETPGRPNPS